MISSIVTALFDGSKTVSDKALEPLTAADIVQIQGESRTGKSSVAFRVAHDFAANGGTALIVCRQHKLEEHMPLYVEDAESINTLQQKATKSSYNPEVLSSILMKYVTTPAELKAVIVGLHAFTPRPGLLVVEDLSTLIDAAAGVTPRNDAVMLDECIAIGEMLADTIHFMNGTVGSGGAAPVKAIITESSHDHHFQRVMRRRVHCTLHLERRGDGTTEPIHLSISSTHSAAAGSEPQFMGTLCLRAEHIVAERFLHS